MVARCDPVQRFSDLDIRLIRGSQKAGVGVARELFRRAGDDVGSRVTDRGDRDAAAQVDEGVAVDIYEDPTARRCRVDTSTAGQAGR